eukprot:c23828_g1_i1 orf=192-779(-)
MAEAARTASLIANPSCKNLLVVVPLNRLSMAPRSHPGLLSSIGRSSGSVLSVKASDRKGPRCCVIRNADNPKKAISSANYVVPLENIPLSSCITRPLAEILRDLNKRVPDKVLKTEIEDGVARKFIPWYHANRMLSFYAPGWCGEVRNILYSIDGKRVTVVYRVIVRGSDGEPIKRGYLKPKVVAKFLIMLSWHV